MADDKLHYKGLPRGKCLGYHTMVLLGMEMTPVKKFILQNWWSRKQFISVSESNGSNHFLCDNTAIVDSCLLLHSQP